MKEAIYIVEYSNIPLGVDMLDKMIKRTEVTVIKAQPICIGKFLIVLGGEVDAMEEAQGVVQEQGERRLISQYLLTNAHKGILAYFKRARLSAGYVPVSDAVGIFEVTNAADGFHSLDAALKSGNVELRKVWLGHFLGGKLCYLLAGSVEDVSMALQAAENHLEPKSLVERRVIPSPDPKTLEYLIRSKQ